MNKIINGRKYDTETAELVASDAYWDGNNTHRGGRNFYLYKTKNGRFFQQNITYWQGEIDSISPLSKKEAMGLFERLPEVTMDYEEAFGVKPEEA